jgi:hypothetical protein
MFVDAPNEIMIYNDGIEACREPWDQRAVKEPPTECLVQLLTLAWVNFIEGWTLLTWSKKRLRFSSDSVHFMSTSSMKRNQESGLWGADCMINFSSLSGRSGLQFASLLWPFKRLLSCCLVSPMYWRPQIAHSRRTTNGMSCPVAHIGTEA